MKIIEMDNFSSSLTDYVLWKQRSVVGYFSYVFVTEVCIRTRCISKKLYHHVNKLSDIKVLIRLCSIYQFNYFVCPPPSLASKGKISERIRVSLDSSNYLYSIFQIYRYMLLSHSLHEYYTKYCVLT